MKEGVVYMDVKRWCQFFTQRKVRGWDDSDTWALNGHLAKWLLPRLRRFRELTCGHPPGLTMDEWRVVLGDMIYAMEISERELESVVTECDWDRVERGLTAFGERFRDLWW